MSEPIAVKRAELLALEKAVDSWRMTRDLPRNGFDIPEGATIQLSRKYTEDTAMYVYEFFEFDVQLGNEHAKVIVSWTRDTHKNPAVHIQFLKPETTDQPS